jgi:FtsH-binding integral membrane protein
MNSDPLSDRVNANQWRKVAGWLQYTLLALLFVTMFALDHMSKSTAKVAVVYFCAVLCILLVISAFLSHKAHKMTMKVLNADLERIKEMTNAKLRENN